MKYLNTIQITQLEDESYLVKEVFCNDGLEWGISDYNNFKKWFEDYFILHHYEKLSDKK